MIRSKKLVSLAVVLTMLVTMLSSFVVVNAADKEVYTAVSEDGATLTIGYRGFEADLIARGIDVYVKLPEGFTAAKTDITVDPVFGDAQKNVADGEVLISNSSTDGFNVGAEGVIATVKLTKAENAAGKFEVTFFELSKTVFDSYSLENGVVANEAEYGKVVEPTPTPIPTPDTMYVSVKGGEVKDGASTLTIGYGNFEADLIARGIDVYVKLPAGVTAAKEDITVDPVFGDAQKNVADGEVLISNSSTDGFNVGAEGVIATVNVKIAEGTDLSKALAEVTFFELSKTVFDSYSLENGVVTYITPFTTGGEEPTKELAVKAEPATMSIVAGKTAEATVTVENATDAVVTTVATSDDKVATAAIADGKVTVTAVAEGTATITVTAKDGDKEATATIAVTVTKEAEKPVEKPAVEATTKTEEKTVAGAKVTFFNATLAPAQGVTTEQINAVISDTETYQVVFDGTTAKGYAAGYAVAADLSAAKVKDALANGTNILDVSINIGGAETVKVTLLDSKGNTIVLPEA